MFYAPARGMGEVRDRAPLMPAVLLALLSQAGYALCTQWLVLQDRFVLHGALGLIRTLFQSISSLLFIALVFVPVTALVANIFERRASFGLVIQQDYASLASTILYAWAAANLAAIPLAILAHVSGAQAAYVANSQESTAQLQTWMKLPPEVQAQLANPEFHAANLFRWLMLLLFGVWTVWAVREVFRVSWLRTVAVVFVSGVAMFPATFLIALFFLVLGPYLTSPFVLLLLFLLLRGYVGELRRTQRARAAFKQNLEAATLNPADASAHYNLGLIHQQRNELEAARQRFERAVEIDADEVDAHYQLGRIARAQNRLADAIKHFEQVITRDPAHAQHEIWREIGATYVAAGQFEDARDSLERFLNHRSSDPEGLYLMGRAHAGLGHRREAADSMQACIEAVKTAPAYKYRTDKRWLNEARQFIKSGQ